MLPYFSILEKGKVFFKLSTSQFKLNDRCNDFQSFLRIKRNGYVTSRKYKIKYIHNLTMFLLFYFERFSVFTCCINKICIYDSLLQFGCDSTFEVLGTL